ncbi:MAG: GerAB/ArcD/ProY family transporter [Bacillota bacterium]
MRRREAPFAWKLRKVWILESEFWIPPPLRRHFYFNTFLINTDNNIAAIARLAELYIFMLALFSVIIILPVREINWGVFLPVGDAGLPSVLQGVLVTSYSFGGIFILLLIYPEIRHKARAAPAAVLGVTITMPVYLILTVMAIGLFSRAALQEDIFPVQNLISLTKLELIQRIDVIFLYLNLTTVVTTQAPFSISRPLVCSP